MRVPVKQVLAVGEYWVFLIQAHMGGGVPQAGALECTGVHGCCRSVTSRHSGAWAYGMTAVRVGGSVNRHYRV